MKQLNTHSFKEKLLLKNKNYQNGEFKVIGEYIHSKTPVLVKTKYGICNSPPTHLMRGCSPSIRTAIDKHQYFLNMLLEKNEHYKNNEFKVLSKYKNEKTPIVIKTKYGYCRCYTSNLLMGGFTTAGGAIFKHNYFLQQLHEKNKQYRDRHFQVIGSYKTLITKIKIKYKGRIYEVLPANLLNKNLFKFTLQSIFSIEDYIVSKLPINCQFIKILNETKVELYCSKHGNYIKRYDSSRTYNCPECSKCIKGNSFRFTEWCKMGNSDLATFYVLQLSNNDESFIKIGITSTSVERRYHSQKSMPYDYKILYLKQSSDKKEIWDLEVKMKQQMKNYKYSPQIKFGGSYTECFTLYSLNCLNSYMGY